MSVESKHFYALGAFRIDSSRSKGIPVSPLWRRRVLAKIEKDKADAIGLAATRREGKAGP